MIPIDADEPFDIDFLTACVAGDVVAFTQLYRRHASVILRYAWSHVTARELAEELLQETFVTAWEKRKRATIVDESLLPWLLVICRNHLRNQTRREHRRASATVPLADVEVGAAADPYGRHDEFVWIREEFDRLSEIDKQVCRLCLIDGYTYEEAAKLTALSPGAVGKRLQRIRSRLRHAVGE